MLKSKRITVREAQKSKPSPKEKNKPSPKKQVQGHHERIKKARRLETQIKKHQEEKRNPWQEVK